MPRNPHFAVDDLSETAQAIARHGVEANRREDELIAEILATTGEVVAHSSFNRWAIWYRSVLRAENQARIKTEAAARIAAERGQEMTAACRAEVLEAFNEMARLKELKAMGPFYLGLIVHKFVEADQKERQLALREKQLELDKRKIEAMENKAVKLRAAAEGVKEIVENPTGELTPEHLQKIQELYGLASE